MAADLAQQLWLPEERLAVLPNPVDVERIRISIRLNPAPPVGFDPGPGPHLLAVGRLAREKGFDLLLRALASVRREYPEASLLIAGSGPEEAALRAECRALGLDRAVSFAGQLADPWPYFQRATLFVLPSRQEGLPNACLLYTSEPFPL